MALFWKIRAIHLRNRITSAIGLDGTGRNRNIILIYSCSNCLFSCTVIGEKKGKITGAGVAVLTSEGFFLLGPFSTSNFSLLQGSWLSCWTLSLSLRISIFECFNVNPPHDTYTPNTLMCVTRVLVLAAILIRFGFQTSHIVVNDVLIQSGNSVIA